MRIIKKYMKLILTAIILLLFTYLFNVIIISSFKSGMSGNFFKTDVMSSEHYIPSFNDENIFLNVIHLKNNIKHQNLEIKSPEYSKYTDMAECLLLERRIIPLRMIKVINQIVQNDVFSMPKCGLKSKKDKFTFLKLHYTGGELVSDIMRRYSLTYNLSVVLPNIDKETIGWPHQPEPIMHEPARTGGYETLMDYVIYNTSYIQSIMHKDSVFITMVRHPVNRLIPVFDDYFAMGCVDQPESTQEVVKEFMQHKIEYDSVYSSPENMHMKKQCFCLYGVSLLQNAMAFDLGFPTGYHMKPSKQTYNYDYIANWLANIVKDIPVIMISEYMDLSLIMLKQYMCWSFKDIMYIEYSVSDEDLDSSTEGMALSSDEIVSFGQWSNVDTLLYILLNATFWSRVDKLGRNFIREAEVYQLHKHKVTKFCLDVLENRSEDKLLQVPGSEWDSAYVIDAAECESLMPGADNKLMAKLRDEYYGLSDADVIYPVDSNQGRFHHKWC